MNSLVFSSFERGQFLIFPPARQLDGLWFVHSQKVSILDNSDSVSEQDPKYILSFFSTLGKNKRPYQQESTWWEKVTLYHQELIKCIANPLLFSRKQNLKLYCGFTNRRFHITRVYLDKRKRGRNILLSEH